MALNSFDISSKTGLLPESPPLASLPPYFSEYSEVVSRFCHLLREHKLRDAIHALPRLEFTGNTLRTVEAWRAALVVLSGLFQGYVWQDGETGIPRKVPSILAVPFDTVSKKIGTPPIGTYASSVLYNWRLRDPEGGMAIENLSAIINLTGTDDESWFFMIHVVIELAAAPALSAIWNGIGAIEEGNNAALLEDLTAIESAINEMSRVMSRLPEGCSPKTFYVDIRRYIAGIKGISAFPDGIIYEGVDSKPRQYLGASGTESTSIKAIDIFLGVQHSGKIGQEIDAVDSYMPMKHREFLQHLSKQASTRQYIIKSCNNDLIKQFNATIDALVAFRNSHFATVTRFIVNQKEHTVFSCLKDTGTGGTDFVKFLKDVRDNTKAVRI